MAHAYADNKAISCRRSAYLAYFYLPSFCLPTCLSSFCLLICCLSFFFTSEAVYAAQSSLTLVQVARVTIDNHFSDHPKTIGEIVETLSKNIHPSYRHSKGLFITLSKHGKTRACWGQISGTENNLVAATAFTTEGALTKEYRYPPIKRQEVPGLDVQVTVIDRVEPVERHVSLHPLLDGLMVRSGGKAAVLLPGEASDGHYQVMQCKVKAGITPSEPCQMYRIKAHVFR